MSAVFVVTQERLQTELRKAGFGPTPHKTEHNTIWENAKGEQLVVNHTHDAFPPEYLNELLGVYGIKATWQGEVIHNRKYKCTPEEGG